MSHLDDETISIIKQKINQYIKGSFSDFKENLLESNNNSFVFLEKDSLNFLLAYLLLIAQNTAAPVQKEEFEAPKLAAQLDELIEDNKNEFEMLLNLFRNSP